VYVGVSGGKDSQALAYRVQEHLDAIGHSGVRALIHADLVVPEESPKPA
jgi:tRNA(Ile)-lysidine synthase TilS/MesJ